MSTLAPSFVTSPDGPTLDGPAAAPSDHPSLAVYGAAAPTAPRTLVDVLESAVAEWPEATALEGLGEEGTETLTYAELWDRVHHHARRLAGHGVSRGDRVGVRVPSGTTDLYVGILAVLAVGAAYVPVDWDDPDERARTVFGEAGVAVVLGEGLAVAAPEGAPRPAPVPAAAPGAPEPSDDAWVIFTSGTTGTPKGVAITHRSAAALVDAEALMYLRDRPLAPGDRVMAGLSVGFDASCEEMWLAWRHGAALVAASRDVVRSGPDLGRWILQQGITAISTVPTLASFWPDAALRQIRLLIFGGEAVPPELVARVAEPAREVWNTYGPTEATVIASGAVMRPGEPVRIGRPVPGWHLAVVDAEGSPVPWGEPGELVIGGVGLGRYLDAAKDAEKYAPLPALGWDRAYRTGDMVVGEPEGILFQGRVDDQVKIGGKRVELGEVDAHLTSMPGVRVGAAAVHRSEAGTPVLCGYLTAEDGVELDLPRIRTLLAELLPGGVSPSLAVLEAMPLKSSGKVDRKALPWPLPTADGPEGLDHLPPRLRDLAEHWVAVLGPVPLEEDADFFALGGGSVAVAQLVTRLRERHPFLEFPQVYQHSTLAGMAALLEGLGDGAARERRPLPEPVPRRAGIVQALWMLALTTVTALRYVTGSVLMVWLLAVVAGAGWVVAPPLAPVLAAWLVLFSLPSRVVCTAIVVRLLQRGLRPGRFRRGGPEHLRVWMADRAVAFARLEPLYGGPLAVGLHRALGTRVGRHATLWHTPSVTGLVRIGARACVEQEVDMHGHWVDGDEFVLGEIAVGEGARVGARSIVLPGTRVGLDAEIQSGSRVAGRIGPHEYWGGSPLVHLGEAGQTWPAEDPRSAPEVRAWPVAVGALMQGLGLAVMGVLPLLASLPWAALALVFLRPLEDHREVFAALMAWTPVLVVGGVLTWLLLVAGLVRLLSLAVRPGFYPVHSPTAWATAMILALLQRTLTSTYPLYASAATPVFFRMMGARVGRDVELSTVETIPHLTVVHDNSFMADHAMGAVPRVGRGWLHVGVSSVGTGSFVGNSAILGPDRDLPPDSLVAVLGVAPYRPEPGTSWLGRTPHRIPRQRVAGDASATFRPSTPLRVARGLVEAGRLLPFVIAGWLDLFVVAVLTQVYMSTRPLTETSPWVGLAWATLAAVPLAVVVALVSGFLPVLVKWALMGPFTVRDEPLHSMFVWKNELMDAFVEILAVPSLMRIGLGSPLTAQWHRAMGARIGRGAWVETWWLPEFDLVTVGDAATVNRGTVLQTHLFHDRVMSMRPVTLEDGATLGPNSFVLPGASLGEAVTVRPGSLVLRDDAVPGHSDWSGNPVRAVTDDAEDDLSPTVTVRRRGVRPREEASA